MLKKNKVIYYLIKLKIQ